MEGTWKSENLNGDLGDDFLVLAPFGPAVAASAIQLVNAKKREFINGKVQIFAGPIKDNKGVERIKSGQVLQPWQLNEMDWLAEGIIGQTK